MLDVRALVQERLLRPAAARLVGPLTLQGDPMDAESTPSWIALDRALRDSPRLVAAARKAIRGAAVPAAVLAEARRDVTSWAASQTETSWAAMDGRVKSDFREGRVVDVEGWVLSLAEVSLISLGPRPHAPSSTPAAPKR